LTTHKREIKKIVTTLGVMKTKLSILSALVCIGSAELLAGTNFDQQMSLQEKQQTGVVNLTLKQRMALASWIDNNYTSKTPLPPNPSCREAQAPLAAAQAPNSARAGWWRPGWASRRPTVMPALAPWPADQLA
jgi:hypothetical protein